MQSTYHEAPDGGARFAVRLQALARKNYVQTACVVVLVVVALAIVAGGIHHNQVWIQVTR